MFQNNAHVRGVQAWGQRGWVGSGDTSCPELRFRVPGGKEKLEVEAGLLLWSLWPLPAPSRSSSLDTHPSLKRRGRKVEGRGGSCISFEVGDSSCFIYGESVWGCLLTGPPGPFNSTPYLPPRQSRRMTWSWDRNDRKLRRCLVSPGACCCGCSVARVASKSLQPHGL